MADDEERLAKYQRQTTEIYAAIGRYVEAFEQLVFDIRFGCQLLTCPPAPTVAMTGRQQRLMGVVFNHQSMTAGNLFRIYRALVGEILSDGNQPGFSDDDKALITGVLQQFDREFQRVISTRNDYLHGTWSSPRITKRATIGQKSSSTVARRQMMAWHSPQGQSLRPT
ncbi:MAG: hypothetical protein WDN31_18835 [Hyphomicrobium sp.]